MNPLKKNNYLKSLDDLLLCVDIDDVKRKINKIKGEIDQNKLEEKLWKSPYGSPIFQIIVILMLLFCLSKLTIIENHWFDAGKKSKNEISYDIIDISIYFFWLVMPPIFFLVEYVVLFGKNESNRLNSDQISDLKYCQELGSKIWAAVVICFSILLYVRYGFKF